MTTIRLSEEIENRLTQLSTLTHRSKSFYIKEALKKYLEDMEDYYTAVERLVNADAKYYTSDEVKKRLGL